MLTAGVAWFVGCAGGVEEGKEGGTVRGVGRGRISSIVGVVLEEGSGHFSYRRVGGDVEGRRGREGDLVVVDAAMWLLVNLALLRLSLSL